MNNPFRPTNKDNLTDVVEALPQKTPTSIPTPTNTGSNNNSGNKPAPTNSPQQRPNQQVTASDGQTVTLGHNPLKK